MNTRDVQAALNGHGFPCSVDGDAGPQTTTQIKRFQQAFCGPGGWLDVDGIVGPRTLEALSWTAANNALVSFFSIDELACHHCGCAYVDRALLAEMFKLRQAHGPLTVLCAYRCPSHNQSVGGASSSQHLFGLAFDPPRSEGLTVGFVKTHTNFTGIGTPNPRAGDGAVVTHLDVRPGSRIVFADASVG